MLHVESAGVCSICRSFVAFVEGVLLGGLASKQAF